MKKGGLAIGSSLVLLTSAFGQDAYDSIQVDGIWRTYMTHLPAGYDPGTSYPLVLGFHGGQQAATSALGWAAFAFQSELSEKADSEGFIVVYPEGRVFNQNRSWNAGACCPPAMNQNVDDVGFVDRLLDTLREQYPIDTTRVYATGSSNGGMLCYRLACELGHRFAAIAPNACSQMYASCAPTNKIPIISFHSKVDPIVPFSGGPGGAPPLTNIVFPSQDSILQFWSLWNECQTIDTVINGNGTGYDLIKAQDCACEVEVHQIATTDGGHSWPGGNPNNNPVSTQVSATDLLWSFFLDHTLGCLSTGAEEASSSEAALVVIPNPFTSTLQVANAPIAELHVLTDLLGQVIWLGPNIGQADLSGLSNGLYFLRIGNRSRRIMKQ